ncbi:MAG: ribosome small subunit-dependent GTPase A [Defluviitaleaceae bacterium]|nr:ribosome small subunit-dependent GTPase A [Defluviitaleaceae bacterium]
MNKNGLITKGVGGLYTVLTDEGYHSCTARGIFRNKKITPLTGDKVEILIEDEQTLTATIVRIKDRVNELTRPAVANVDQVIITMSVKQPDFNAGLLDRFLVLAAHAGIDAVICVNKCDLLRQPSEGMIPMLVPYQTAGYPLVFTSRGDIAGINGLREVMKGKLTVFAGPSGVGKSSLINALLPHAEREVGEISAKLKRGKHTTRAAEILLLGESPASGFVVDTPGFSSLEIEAVPVRAIASYFKEFSPFMGQCRFNDCLHADYDKTEDCMVKAQIGKGIHPMRYEGYLKLINRNK